MTARRLTPMQQAHVEKARVALRRLGYEVEADPPMSAEGQAKRFYRFLSAPRPVRTMPTFYGNFYELYRSLALNLIGQVANEGGLL